MIATIIIRINIMSGKQLMGILFVVGWSGMISYIILRGKRYTIDSVITWYLILSLIYQCWSRGWVCVWVLRRKRTDSMLPSTRRPSRPKVMSCDSRCYVEIYCQSTTWLSMRSSILTTIPIPTLTMYHGFHLLIFYRRYFDQTTKPF